MKIELVTPSDSRIISLDDVKKNINVDTADDDAKILRLIQAAEAYLDGRDGVIGRSFRPTVWKAFIPAFKDCIELPLPPTLSVISIEYYDDNDTLQTLASSFYRVIEGGSTGDKIIPEESTTYPNTNTRPDAVQITFQAGYQDAESPENEAVIETVRLAVSMLVKSWYDNEGSQDIPELVKSLIAPIRLTYVG